MPFILSIYSSDDFYFWPIEWDLRQGMVRCYKGLFAASRFILFESLPELHFIRLTFCCNHNSDSSHLKVRRVCADGGMAGAGSRTKSDARATLLAAANANYPSARLLASLVRLLIIILVVTMALEQIGLGRHVVLIAFSIAFGAVMLGAAIAFGLGGRDVARQMLERKFLEKDEKEEEISPL